MKINAIIESKDGGTLVLDFPRSIYDVYEKLQSVGIRQSPHQITLSDEEGDDVRVKLYSEDEIGKHLLKVAVNMKNADPQSETAKAIQEYFGGKHGATHKIAYQEIAILTPVRVLATSKMTLPGRTWEHLNVWDCPYKMKFDAAEVSQIIIRYDGMYRRCIRAKFTDLCYEGIKGEWRPVGSVLFGNASVIEFNSDTGSFENLLYVQEDVSDTKEQLETKLDNPDEIILDRICDEVFGDG